MDVSIFIPVYKESNQLAGALDVLASQNVSKEIFITVDQPTEEFLKEIKPRETENVKFIVNKERTGKANA
jgi:cellulose synthase/poly-beta-1,6-N-acetylglucosamine synthase-like glycosyltransferase